jgi:hypothetical protein
MKLGNYEAEEVFSNGAERFSNILGILYIRKCFAASEI